MSISSAIAATSPNLWWKLDEGAGSTANNSGSLANDGAVTGTVDWRVDGPEFGTTGIRLYAGAEVRSAGMDVMSLGPYTLGMWISAWADGTVNVNYPVLNIGNPDNRMQRGPVIWERHATFGAPSYGAAWGGGTTVPTVAVPGYARLWHWVVFTVDAGTGNTKLYVDGQVGTSVTTTTHNAAASTDPLLLRCDESVAVAHVCFWAGVLTPTQILSISNEIAPWPFTTPVNTPPEEGAGGGFPPEESAKLDDILGYVDDLPGMLEQQTYGVEVLQDLAEQVDGIDTRLNDVNGKVDEALGHLNTLMAVTAEQVLPNIAEVRDFVSRLLYSAGGVALNAGIGSILAHPDPNLLHESVEEYLISGRGTMPSPGPLNYGNVYAVRWRTVEQPDGAGVRYGVVPEFTRRLVQWVLFYTDVSTLVAYPQVIADFLYESYTYYWPRYAPTEIAYDVAPGFVLGVRYIMFAPTP